MKAPRDVVGVAGDSIELSCRVGGDPVPQITWRRIEGGRMPVGRSELVKDRGLILKPLRVEDAGVYACDASNKAATVIANATLIVQSKLSIITFFLK